MNERQDHRDTYKIRFIIGGIALAVFFLMLYLFETGASEEFDNTVGAAVRSIRCPALDVIMIGATYIGSWYTIVGIGVLLLIADAVKWHEWIYPVAVGECLLSTALYELLKQIIRRPRPDEAYWIISEQGYSFPSGHSMNGMFCYGVMIYLLWRRCGNENVRKIMTIVLCILIPTIAISRLYCGVHYPTDVIGGMSMGLALLMFATVTMDEYLINN